MRNSFTKFLTDDSGAAGVEYGLLVAAIAALMVVIVFAIGGGVRSGFVTVCNTMTQYVTGMGSCD